MTVTCRRCKRAYEVLPEAQITYWVCINAVDRPRIRCLTINAWRPQ